jgi:hypothetical protein
MAQVVTFPHFPPRTARRSAQEEQADGDENKGKVIVFTGVWQERVTASTPKKKRKKPAK